MPTSAADLVFAALVLVIATSGAVALWILRCVLVRISDDERLGLAASIRWRIHSARLATRPQSDRLVAPLMNAVASGEVHIASVSSRGMIHRRLHLRFDDGRALELRAYVAAEADRFAQLWRHGDILGVRIRFLPSAGWVVSSAAGRRDATCFSYAAHLVV